MLAFNPASFARHVERSETSLILFRARSVERIDPEIPLPPMRDRNDRAMTLNTDVLGQFHQRGQRVIHRCRDAKLRAAAGYVSV